MPRKLKPFGAGGLSYEHGFSLPVLVSHLEGLVDDEQCAEFSPWGRRAKRLAKAEEALALLQDALDMGGEE